MSEVKRYTDRIELTGKLMVELRQYLVVSFPSIADMKEFVSSKLGDSVLQSINWDASLNSVAFDLVANQLRAGGVASLVEDLQLSSPYNKELSEFVAYLVEAGYLVDSNAPAAERAYKTDWVQRFGTDRVGLDEANRVLVVDAIAESVVSVAALELLLSGSFRDEHSGKIRNELNRKLPLKTNIESVMAGFERLSRLNAFLLAVQNVYQSNMILAFVAASVLTACKPKPAAEPAPQPAPAAPVSAATQAAPAATATATAQAAPAATATVTAQATTAAPATASAPAEFRVSRAVATLSAAQAQALSRMMTNCFSSHDLDRLCHLYTGERLDHIVANGPLRKMAEDLVRWCEEQQDKLVPLLNGMVKERPGRPDLKDFLRKLAGEGAIEVEG